ncbi:hypothetical protein CgunFtcFv8_018236 [Champsocephalus gunnari]|uniref:Uncharacterized protein n=1 Tax=Champsocephalus gunnari TaxID=52237 RepID=A0AAN8DM40_CHAGU|nr:hypothetical protein CgunFtcFv8_018236 [Champsocephalus gunnari]
MATETPAIPPERRGLFLIQRSHVDVRDNGNHHAPHQGHHIHVTASVKPEPVQMKDIIFCSGATRARS